MSKKNKCKSANAVIRNLNRALAEVAEDCAGPADSYERWLEHRLAESQAEAAELREHVLHLRTRQEQDEVQRSTLQNVIELQRRGTRRLLPMAVLAGGICGAVIGSLL